MKNIIKNLFMVATAFALGGCMVGVPVAIISTGFEDMIDEQAGEEKETDVYELLKEFDNLSDVDKKRFIAYVSVEPLEDEKTPEDADIPTI